MANELKFVILIDTKTGQASVAGLTDKLKGIGDAAQKGSGTAVSSFGNMAMGLNQTLELANKVMGVLATPLKNAGQFEGYQTSLKVMLGSTDAAQKRLAELVKFAAETPFELPQVVQAGNQLQAIGKYSLDNMKMLGDLASAAGKPYEQVLSAYAKLATGQKGVSVDMFRDLLISSQDWQDATGKGVAKTGELLASTTEMMNALPKILEKKGFAGMMAEQSKTMMGQWSNFQDAIGQGMTEFGNILMPMAKNILGVLTPIFSFLKDNIGYVKPLLTGAAVGLGIFGLAMLSTSVSSGTLATSMTYLNGVMLANPVAVIAIGVAALITAMSLLNDVITTTTEEKVAENKAELEGLKTKQETVKTVISEKENNIKLLNEYKSLASEKKKTADQTKRMSDLNNILGEKYPGLIKSGTDYRQNLVGIESQLTKTKNEAYGLSQEYQNLSKVQKQIMIKLAESQMEEALQKAWDIKGGVQNAAFMTEFYEALWNTKSIGDVDTKTLRAFKLADQAIVDGIYKQAEKPEVYAAIKAMATLRQNQLNIWSSSDVETAKKPDDKKAPVGATGAASDKPVKAVDEGDFGFAYYKGLVEAARINANQYFDSIAGIDEDLIAKITRLERIGFANLDQEGQKNLTEFVGLKGKIDAELVKYSRYQIENVNKLQEIASAPPKGITPDLNFMKLMPVPENPMNKILKQIEEDQARAEVVFGTIENSFTSFGNAMGESLISGFDSKKVGDNLKAGLKSILLAELAFLEKKYLLGEATSVVNGILNPATLLVSIPTLIAGEIALMLARGAITAWGVGGYVDKPTLSMIGESGPEIIAPERGFISLIDSIIDKTRLGSMQQVAFAGQSVKVEFAPIEMKQRGRDLSGVLKQNNKLDSLRKF